MSAEDSADIFLAMKYFVLRVSFCKYGYNKKRQKLIVKNRRERIMLVSAKEMLEKCKSRTLRSRSIQH